MSLSHEVSVFLDKCGKKGKEVLGRRVGEEELLTEEETESGKSALKRTQIGEEGSLIVLVVDKH